VPPLLVNRYSFKFSNTKAYKESISQLHHFSYYKISSIIIQYLLCNSLNKRKYFSKIRSIGHSHVRLRRSSSLVRLIALLTLSPKKTNRGFIRNLLLAILLIFGSPSGIRIRVAAVRVQPITLKDNNPS
jgi:hypothetical protein